MKVSVTKEGSWKGKSISMYKLSYSGEYHLYSENSYVEQYPSSSHSDWDMEIFFNDTKLIVWKTGEGRIEKIYHPKYTVNKTTTRDKGPDCLWCTDDKDRGPYGAYSGPY